MSRTVFRTLTGAFALVAATALIPLGSPARAAEDGIVIGGQLKTRQGQPLGCGTLQP